MSKKVLFIDDEVDILEAVKMLLENEGFEVKTVSDINSAKEVIDYMPDIILTDVLLSKKTAEDICKILKEDSMIKNIPVILLSAQSLPKLLETVKRSGARDYLQKPFEIDDLTSLIKKHLKS